MYRCNLLQQENGRSLGTLTNRCAGARTHSPSSQSYLFVCFVVYIANGRLDRSQVAVEPSRNIWPGEPPRWPCPPPARRVPTLGAGVEDRGQDGFETEGCYPTANRLRLRRTRWISRRAVSGQNKRSHPTKPIRPGYRGDWPCQPSERKDGKPSSSGELAVLIRKPRRRNCSEDNRSKLVRVASEISPNRSSIIERISWR